MLLHTPRAHLVFRLDGIELRRDAMAMMPKGPRRSAAICPRSRRGTARSTWGSRKLPRSLSILLRQSMAVLAVLSYPVSVIAGLNMYIFQRSTEIFGALVANLQRESQRFERQFVVGRADRIVVKPDGIALKAGRIVGTCNGIVGTCEEMGPTSVGMRLTRVSLSGCGKELSRKTGWCGRQNLLRPGLARRRCH